MQTPDIYFSFWEGSKERNLVGKQANVYKQVTGENG